MENKQNIMGTMRKMDIGQCISYPLPGVSPSSLRTTANILKNDCGKHYSVIISREEKKINITRIK